MKICEYDSTTVFVFLAITWGEMTPDSDGENCEAFGPFVVQQDGSHLSAIEDILKDWRSRHPERPNMAAHLFATDYQQRFDSESDRVTA